MPDPTSDCSSSREFAVLSTLPGRLDNAAPYQHGAVPALRARTTARSRLAAAVLGLVVVLLAARGITREGTVSLQGDMPRYLMNGVYFWDLLRAWPVTHPLEYTYRYFAKYPALSLGHHPLLPGMAEVPFYAVFGVSVLSARLPIIGFLLIAVSVWYRLVERLYDRRVALCSALLLATSPFVVASSRVVMSEIPALALLIVATYCCYQYGETLRRRDALLLAVTAAASAYGKQHCVFMFPIFAVYLARRRGLGSLFSRDLLVAAGLTLLLLGPLIPLTLEFSRINVNWVRTAGATSHFALANLLYYPAALWSHLLSGPVLVLSLLSLGLSVVRRDGRALLPVLWVVGFYLQITYVGVHDPRLAIYWIPPFCLLAAATVTLARSPRWQTALTTGLLLIGGYQILRAAGTEPTYAEGYEEAAQYVLAHRKGESVLFSGNIDSGFFVFFVRKHDPQGRMVVLRADKTLVTSSLARIIDTQRTTREQIYAMLRDFGTAYVVIEDAAYESPPLELLRQELKSEHFVLRQRIPIRSNSDKLRGVDLLVYEFVDYSPARRDRLLEMRVPLMGANVAVRFGDLLPE